MSKSLPIIDISSEDLRNTLIGGSGAGLMFFIQRFFKNKDSINERVRKLERQQAKMETQLDQINNNIASIDRDINNLRKYNKEAHHKTRTMLSEKMLKDNIVDEIHKSLVNIEKGLTDEKK